MENNNLEMNSTCASCSGCGLCATEIELFEGLDRKEHIALTTKSIHENYKKNDILFSPEDDADRIIIIRSGKVKLCDYDENGKEYIYDIVAAGGIIGEQKIFSGGLFDSYGICLTNVATCTLTKIIIEDLILENPSFGVKFIGTMGKKLAETRELSRILSIDNPKKRVAEFLVTRSNILGGNEIELSRETIASAINLSRETVSRKLTELSKDDLVELIGYKKIFIKDKAKLLNI